MRSNYLIGVVTLALVGCGDSNGGGQPRQGKGNTAAAETPAPIPQDNQPSDTTPLEQTEDTDPPPVQTTGIETRSRVLQDETYGVTTHLDSSSVLCSSADYSAFFLKVLIPGVADVTIFDHRNFGVGAPCMAAGVCTEEFGVETILGAGEGDVDHDLRVLLTALYIVDHDLETCTVFLQEELFTTIRGVNFYHERSGQISERAYADCLGI